METVLSLALSETPKTGFLASRSTYSSRHLGKASILAPPVVFGEGLND